MNEDLFQTLKSQKWEEILKKLYAHAIVRARWFGLSSELRVQGKEPKDFVHEAITLLYEGARKWDQGKYPDLLQFLKYTVNSLIWNASVSKERKSLAEVDTNNEMSDALLFDNMMEANIIGESLISEIEQTLGRDEVMRKVFRWLVSGLTPSDISDQYEMDIVEVRNAQKRLRRHINKIMNLKSSQNGSK